jgi:hypothetical protein
LHILIGIFLHSSAHGVRHWAAECVGLLQPRSVSFPPIPHFLAIIFPIPIADLLNFEFECKIGFNIGPVTAGCSFYSLKGNQNFVVFFPFCTGVIGTTKLYYDIWGDTVNIASRMYQASLRRR